MNKYKSTLLLLTIIITTSLSAKDVLQNFERRFDEMQEVNDGALFEISSSFSDIEYKTWNKNQIQASVILSVDCKNEKDAERFFDKVDFSFEGNRSKVKLKTKWEGNWNSSRDGDFKIKVIVFAPASVQLDLEHSFGGCDINEVHNAKIESEYGSLTIGECMGEGNEIEVNFGTVSIGAFGGGELDVEYGEANVGSVMGSSEFSVSFSSAELGIEQMNPGSITLNCSYSDCTLRAEKDQSIYLKYEGSFSDISTPSWLKEISKAKEMFSEEIEASNGNGAIKLLVNNSFGDVKIKS